MALEIDAFAVLRAINAHHATFADIRGDASKAAGALAEKLRALIVKQIKSKSGNLSSIQDIRRALGPDAFSLVLNGMKESEIKALVGKLDKHHPDRKSANTDWCRRHLRALLDGSASPSMKAVPMKKTKGGTQSAKRRSKSATKDEPGFPFDESAGAVRKR